MGKKSRNKRIQEKEKLAANPSPAVSVSDINSARTEIPALWIAISIPLVCAVGAWTTPAVATPMELKSYASQIYLAGLLLIWMWINKNSHTNNLNFSFTRLCLGLLFLFGTMSIIWASNAHFWVYKWNKWFAALSIFLLAFQVKQSRDNLNTLIALTTVGGLIVAVIGILQYLFGFSVIPQTSFPSSTFGNGNMAGQVVVLTFLLPLYFLFQENLTKPKIWFYAISAALLLTYAYYTRTRAVWLSCFLEIGLIGIFILLDKKRRTTWLFWSKEKTRASIVAIAAFFLLINLNMNGFQPFWNVAAKELSSIADAVGSSAAEGEVRYIIWTSTLEIIKDKILLGYGLGNFFDVYNTGAHTDFRILGVQRVHNDIMELIVEIGAIGAILLAAFIVGMCVALCKLTLYSDGYKRILYAILAAAITGSMLNAQVSFPYQLPVPLLIMPLFLSIIIRGKEDIEPESITIPIKSWFNKLSLVSCFLIFLFILTNDLLWMRDIHMLNRVVNGEQNSAWKPNNPIYNQAYITGGRSVAQALKNTDLNQRGIYALEPLLEYWPDVPANSIVAAEMYLAEKKYDEAEFWARKAIVNEAEGSYLGEFYLMSTMMAKNDIQALSEIYNEMKNESEELLSQSDIAYNMLHSMSINLGDYEMTNDYYEKFLKYYGETSETVGNQAIFLLNTGKTTEALPFIHRALELDPNLPYAEYFNNVILQIQNQ